MCGWGRVVRRQMIQAQTAKEPSRKSNVPRVKSTNQSDASTHSRRMGAVPLSGRGKKARRNTCCMAGAGGMGRAAVVFYVPLNTRRMGIIFENWKPCFWKKD